MNFKNLLLKFDFGNILLDKKSCENIFIYVSYKTFVGAKRLHIVFDKVNGFIGDYDGTKYLVLIGLKKYDAIYGIRYFV